MSRIQVRIVATATSTVVEVMLRYDAMGHESWAPLSAHASTDSRFQTWVEHHKIEERQREVWEARIYAEMAKSAAAYTPEWIPPPPLPPLSHTPEYPTLPEQRFTPDLAPDFDQWVNEKPLSSPRGPAEGDAP